MAGEMRVTLGGRIRAARRARSGGMTLEQFGWELARLMGRPRPFDKMAVSYWETDRREPSWEALVAMARLTRLPLEYFAGVGQLEDYPVLCPTAAREQPLDPRLETLIWAAQQFDPPHQRLVIRQLEDLLQILTDEASKNGVA